MVGKKKQPRPNGPTEQKENTVYVPQPQRAEWIPNTSPECLKLETFLRMKEIPYEYMETAEAMAVATYSQLPHCKINGKDVQYSSHMLCEIAKMFNKEMPDCVDEPAIDNGAQRAFEGLIEGSLNWVLIYMRATHADQLPPCDVFQGRFWQFLRPLANKMVTNKLKTKADYQGIGRHDATDVVAIGKQDLRAISAYLGSKETFCGAEPNKLDATAFAQLCQLWYIPSDNELKTYIKEECPNLVEYMERMKIKYWPDWEEKCRKPTPTRRSKSKDESSHVLVEQQQQEGEEGQNNVEPTETTAVNGTTEKESEPTGEETSKQSGESTVEIKPVTTPEEKPQPAENGVAEEQKPVA